MGTSCDRENKYVGQTPSLMPISIEEYCICPEIILTLENPNIYLALFLLHFFTFTHLIVSHQSNAAPMAVVGWVRQRRALKVADNLKKAI